MIRVGAISIAALEEASGVVSALLCESSEGLLIEAERVVRRRDEKERILELWLGRSYCDSGNRRWNL